MLGRFLEISVHAPAIRDSLAFYESLGFVQASVGEAVPYPYAVVTDGRLVLGLHAAPLDSPSLTFVLPQLAAAVAQLESTGLGFEHVQLGEDVFNRATLCDPTGLKVHLLEARTFSPPQLDAPFATTCGYFSELGLPARDETAACAFWEALGFVALADTPRPFAGAALTSAALNLALYRTRTWRRPLLAFEDRNMRERLARLRERGLTVTDELPDSLDESVNGVLVAPEGTRLLLLQSED